MTEFITKHPDSVLGPEAAMEVAGEIVWLSRIQDLRKGKDQWLADKIQAQQYHRDENGMIYVELWGKKVELGHVSVGFEKLTQEINRPAA